jgi:uridine kinase
MTDRRAAPRPLVLGVAGGSGSGKTTVVAEILARLDPDQVAVIHHDAYYRDFGHLSPGERAALNFDHPSALETELLVHHLQALLAGDPVDVPRYDFTTHTRRTDTLRVDPTDVLIVDGILVLAEAELRRLLDIKIFVDTDADIRFIRRLQRDIRERGRSLDSVIAQYQETVRPMHLDFVEPSRRWADVILPEGGSNRIAIEMVAARLAGALASRSTRPSPTS